MKPREYSAGEVIFSEGDDSQEAYRIISGQVEISIEADSGSMTVSRLGENEIFGEMGMVDDLPRAATARAIEHTTLEVITEDDFNNLVLNQPALLRPYLAALFERLRTANTLLQMELSQRLGKDAQNPVPLETAFFTVPVQVEPSEKPVGEVKVRIVSANPNPHPKDDQVDLQVPKFPYKIGRQCQGSDPSIFADNDLHLRDERPYNLSRNHCVIEQDENGVTIRDRGSSVGMTVNGESLGIACGKVVASLKMGDNEVILGSRNGPHHLKIILS